MTPSIIDNILHSLFYHHFLRYMVFLLNKCSEEMDSDSPHLRKEAYHLRFQNKKQVFEAVDQLVWFFHYKFLPQKPYNPNFFYLYKHPLPCQMQPLLFLHYQYFLYIFEPAECSLLMGPTTHKPFQFALSLKYPLQSL